MALAAGVTVPIAAFTTAPISTGWRSSWSLPVTIRDTSSSWSMIWFCAVALRMMVSMAVRISSGVSCPRWSRYAHPTIAVSGVRSSCDSVARNSSFTRLAVSATVRASCASR